MPTGGWLFEVYLDGFAKTSVFRRFRTAVREAEEKKQEMIDDNECLMILDECDSCCYGWLLVNLGNLTQAGKKQSFYLMFMLRFYGLSRTGCNFLHGFGLGPSLRFYDDQRLNQVDLIRRETR